MALEQITMPLEKTAARARRKVVLPSLVALAVFAAGGMLRLQSDEHVTRYMSPAGISTVIVESAAAHFGGAFDCSSVHRGR